MIAGAGALFIIVMVALYFQNRPSESPTPYQPPSTPVESNSQVQPQQNPPVTTEPKRLAAEIINVRIMPWTSPVTGDRLQMVCIDWRNTGNTPIAAMKAAITALDANGYDNGAGVDETYIFAFEDNGSRKIQPGETYTEPTDLGWILFSNLYGETASVRARIIDVMQE